MGQTEAERKGEALPPIPAKRYFTIGEVADLCGLKPHVLRYWEQEFTQLRPVKRRGNRRYYQHHEVLLVRRIRHLLYEEGFTINGARNRLAEMDDPDGDGVAERIVSSEGVPDVRRELGEILGMLEECMRPIDPPAGSSSPVS